MIQDTTFVVVDTETTGATAANDRVIEIGATKVINGEIVDTFHALINPERFIPHNVIQIHGITDDMVKDSPIFKDVVDGYLNFLGENSVFTAHNVEFDRAFIDHELMRIGLDKMSHQSLCTIKLARRVFPDFRKYNLGALSQTLGITLSNAHRALEDSMATAKVLIQIFQELEKQDKRTMKDINLKSIPQPASTLSLF